METNYQAISHSSPEEDKKKIGTRSASGKITKTSRNDVNKSSQISQKVNFLSPPSAHEYKEQYYSYQGEALNAPTAFKINSRSHHKLELRDTSASRGGGGSDLLKTNSAANKFFNSHTSLNIIGSMVTIDQATSVSTSRLTARQKLYLITIVIAKFVHQLCTFWGAIVYPLEASRRGFAKMHIGMTLIFVSIASWCTSIVLSTSFLKFGGRRAAFNLFITGSLSYGLLTTAISLSSLTSDKFLFGLSFTTFYSIRGMSQALLFSSVNTILLSEEFSGHVSFAKALDTLAYTMGSIFSFILSGYLYGQFGFRYVVIILGSIQSVISLSYIYLLPKKTQSTESTVDKVTASTSFKVIARVVRNPEILCTLMSHCLVYFTLFYLSPIFTPYVTSEFGLSAVFTGMIACLPYLAMSLFGTSWSFVATNRFRRKFCLTIPLILFGCISWLSGPDPLLTQNSSLISLSITLFIGGGFLVSNLVLNTPELRDQAEDHGYNTEDICISATLASLLTSFEFLGEIVGPPSGGCLADLFSERRAFSIGGSLVGLIGVIRAVIYLVNYFKRKQSVENLVRTKSSYI